MELNMEANGKIHKVILRDVKYAPDSPNNLISIGCLTAGGHSAIFSWNSVQFKSGSGIIFAKGAKIGHMYRINTKPVQHNIKLYSLPGNNNDDDIPVPIEGEQTRCQGEQPREAAQPQEAAQPKNKEAGTAQLSNRDESVTTEAPHGSKRLTEISRKDYTTSNNPWHKSYTKPVDTVFISRNSSPVIAPDNFQEKKSRDDREIQEAAAKRETDTEQEIAKIKAELTNSFQLTDLGPLAEILGLKIDCNCENSSLEISQGSYIDLNLDRPRMTDCDPIVTQIAQNVELKVPEEPELHDEYPKAIGSMMCAALGTPPNIAFTSQCLSQFTTNHTEIHYTTLKHIFRYLKTTQILELPINEIRRD